MLALAILGALSGIGTFTAGTFFVVKAIFRQVSATENNTRATDKLSGTVGDLGTKIGNLDTRVAVLEDWKASGRGPGRTTR